MIKAIILAAGSSKRLRPITDERPKCLIELNGETILDYQLRCLDVCGVKEILIISGYKKEKIINHIKKSKYKHLVKIINNPVFHKTDNTYSLSLGLKQIDENKDSVLLLDGDIIFDCELLKKIITAKHKCALIADNEQGIKAEDNKVLIKNDYAMVISKKIKGSAVYKSIIKLNGKLLNIVKKECAKTENQIEWYTDSLTRVLKDFPREVKVIYTKGLLACETDTPEDLIKTKKIYIKLNTK